MNIFGATSVGSGGIGVYKPEVFFAGRNSGYIARIHPHGCVLKLGFYDVEITRGNYRLNRQLPTANADPVSGPVELEPGPVLPKLAPIPERARE
jgi:hypothetical protein